MPLRGVLTQYFDPDAKTQLWKSKGSASKPEYPSFSGSHAPAWEQIPTLQRHVISRIEIVNDGGIRRKTDRYPGLVDGGGNPSPWDNWRLAHATLERRDRLPRWSVGARKKCKPGNELDNQTSPVHFLLPEMHALPNSAEPAYNMPLRTSHPGPSDVHLAPSPAWSA
ncbi:hypothetical protein CCP4SC76_4290006 [Gammaproteobacteria bacterium]